MAKPHAFSQLRVHLKPIRVERTDYGGIIYWDSQNQEAISSALFQFLKHLDGTVEMRELLRFLFHKGQTVFLTEAVEWLKRLLDHDMVVNQHEVESCLEIEIGGDVQQESLHGQKISTTPAHTAQYFTPDRLKSYLSKTPLFSEGQEELLGKIIKSSQLKLIKTGESVITKGRDAKEMYVLLTGALGVYTDSPFRAQNLVATLNFLNLFGESAALFAKKRTAHVVALEPSWVLEIPVAPIKNPDQTTEDLKNVKSLRTRVILNQMIASSRLFSGVTSDIIQFVLSKSSVCTQHVGDIVIQQGEQDLGIYIILKGQFEVIRDGHVVATLNPGDYFGEMATLTRSPRTASVLALGEGLCLKVHQSDLFDLMIRDLRLGLYIEKQMILRLQQSKSLNEPVPQPVDDEHTDAAELDWINIENENFDFSSIGHSS